MIISLRCLFILALCIFCAYAKFKKDPQQKLWKFDLSITTPWRGILCLLIVLHHIYPEVAEAGVADRTFLSYWANWGVPVVCCFFFMTGYGLEISYLKKGDKYIDGFLGKRMFKLLPPYLIAALLFVFIQIIFYNYPISYLFRSFTFDYFRSGLLPLHNCWYVYIVILFYLLFYISHIIFHNNKSALLFTSCGAIIYMIIVQNTEAPIHWSVSTPALIIGLVYPHIESKWRNYIQTYPLRCLMFVFFIASCALIISNIPKEPEFLKYSLYWFLPAAFATTFYFIGPIKSRILTFLGTLSYEIYIVHEIFIFIFGPIAQNWLLFIIVVYGCTIITSFFLHKLVSKEKKS